MTETASGWLALAVTDIDERKLLPDVIAKDGKPPHLPRQMVKIPFDNPDEVAVVSWRWDGDLQTKGSRNIASVVRVAKQRGIRYLFIDTISIDQTLPTSDLVKQVAAFSVLYTKITVLAAYDMEIVISWLHDAWFTVNRPWIWNEMRLFRQNPGRIINVRHNDSGTKSERYASQDIIPTGEYEEKRRSFVVLLETAWCNSFLNSIIGVLLEDVGMSFISDFKYIIQAYTHVISVAYEQMERNDYLLTIAIFCSIEEKRGAFILGQDPQRGIQHLRYSRYSFTVLPDKSNKVWVFYDISLDGITVGLLSEDYGSDLRYPRCGFHMSEDTARLLFAALNRTESEYADFVATEEIRRTSLWVDNREEIPMPAVEVIEVDLTSE